MTAFLPSFEVAATYIKLGEGFGGRLGPPIPLQEIEDTTLRDGHGPGEFPDLLIRH